MSDLNLLARPLARRRWRTVGDETALKGLHSEKGADCAQTLSVLCVNWLVVSEYIGGSTEGFCLDLQPADYRALAVDYQRSYAIDRP